MKVKDIMTQNVITLKPDMTLKEAMLVFAEKKISGAPITDKNKKIIGIISETDILKIIKTRNKELKMVYPSLPIMGISFIEIEKQKEVFEALKEVASISISDFMSKRVITVQQTDSMEDVIPLMIKEKINRVPVVDKEGNLVGIVTRGDILRGLYMNSSEKKT